MYKERFREWGPDFQKNNKRGSKSSETTSKCQPPAVPKRKRGAASLPPEKEKQQARAILVPPEAALALASRFVPRPFSLKHLKVYEQMLHCMGDTVKSLFDKSNVKGRWTWDDFGITAPGGGIDYSDTWKAIAEQCHAASLLCVAGCHEKGLATLAVVRERLRGVVDQDGPWTIVYLWRILLLVFSISHHLPTSRGTFFRGFLLHLHDLVKPHLRGVAGLRGVISALNGVPLKETRNALEIVYRLVIERFGVFMGSMHPTVVAMRSHYLRHWTGMTLSEAVYAHYSGLVRRADDVLGRQDLRCIALRTEYLYAAFYHAGNLDLTHDLALDLYTRVQPMVSTKPHDAPPTWSCTTHAYIMASKLLARVDRDRGGFEVWYLRLKDLILDLQRGDRECRTHAAQVQDMIAHRCRADGMEELAECERQLAAKIRNAIPEEPATGVPGLSEGKWRLDLSAWVCQNELLRAERFHQKRQREPWKKAANRRHKKEARKRRKARKRARKMAIVYDSFTGQQAAVESSGPPFEYVCPTDLVIHAL